VSHFILFVHYCQYAEALLTIVYSSSFSDRILTEEGGIAASTSSLDFAFPPELADALHRLFHLRRGALLSPGPLQSADDRAEMRSLFLRLPLDDCLCIMAPSLWSAEMNGGNGEISLETIPSDTLTLWDNVSQERVTPSYGMLRSN
jgi:hypothetical protein